MARVSQLRNTRGGPRRGVDASDASAPELVRSVPVHGYVSDIDVAGGVAVASLGYDGAQLIYIAD